MESIIRGARNVKRKPGRSVGVVIIIGFSLAIFLTSSIVASSIEAQAANLEDSLGRTIVVTASDASFDSSATISEDILNLTNNMSQVESVQTFVTEVDRSGISAILAQGGSPNPEALRAAVRFISGQNLSVELEGFVSEELVLVDGRMLNESDSGSYNVLLGVEAAFSSEIGVGDSLELEGVSLNVVGLISGEVFQTNATILMSIDIAQAITETTGFDKVVITIDSIELVDDTTNFLRSEYGDEVTVQTASDQQGDDIAQSIDAIGGNADLGAMAALFASLLVVGFIMVIITKERVNEIGVLKAIGLPNSKIVTQFLSESIFMASLGFVVCILITLVAGPMIQTMLIESGSNDASSAEEESTPQQFQPGQILNPTPESSSMDSITSLEFSVDGESILTSFGLTILIGVIGALYPILGALRMQPAQALRYE
uniref:ABC-type antimicrobial peptide transport system, permease component (ABC.CD.P) n=1 Tax=uncultured marine group II/III euryarchaeote KM3_190_A04 TaxID=1457959 RepID=A0A075GV15_9EURY|nr:ABC-type antimicrobial peptide transport system, permease component (ABC.CD.P) [uncultured marine group II/III euryarchaeote KM3_190_A04]